MDQHVEDLRLDRHEQAGAAQLVAIEIELAVAEGEDHTRPSKTFVSAPVSRTGRPATCLVRKEAGVVTPGVMSPAWFGGVGARS